MLPQLEKITAGIYHSPAMNNCAYPFCKQLFGLLPTLMYHHLLSILSNMKHSLSGLSVTNTKIRNKPGMYAGSLGTFHCIEFRMF
jgi:hypothetical protein